MTHSSQTPSRNIALLRKVKRIIARGWTRNTLARDARGRPVSPYGRKGVRFCLLGACYHVTPYGVTPTVANLFAKEMGRFGIIRWNDYVAKSKSDVLALIDKAIAAQKQSAK